MKKFFTVCVILSAAIALSGCSGENFHGYPDIGLFRDTTSGGTSGATGTSGAGGATGAGGVTAGRELRHVTYSLCNDPDNERVITVDGQTLTVEVTNGDWVTDSVSIGALQFSEEKDGDKTIFTADGSSLRSGYLTLELKCHGGYTVNYRIRHDGEGFLFPDVLNVRDINAEVANSPTVLTHEQTLKYITKDGTANGAENVLRQIRSLSDRICRGLRSDYDKLRAISRWVSENIYYDHVAYADGIPAECLTLEYMLERGSSVCGGYAAMTSALCEAQGIKCLHVSGNAINQGNCYAEANNGVHHEWNYAIIGGRGIWVDSGWNSHSHLYDVGNYTRDDISYNYFDIGAEAFALNHKADFSQLRNYFAED